MDDKTQINTELNNTGTNVGITALNTKISDDVTAINGQISQSDSDLTGEIIGGIYTVLSKLPIYTGEADLYICSDGVNDYIAKFYRRKNAVKKEIVEKLKTLNSPYIARILDAGDFKGYTYEIIPYYKNGSLEGRTFTFNQLKNTIIPSLNEGLRVLHDNGIIHKDLKPSNIMLSDNGKDVVIIDFGISSIREDGNTIIVTRTGLTPEYSAPETFKNLFLAESDYYSLGISIYELYCGHTPYSQMSQDEIEQFVSVQKLPLPNDMENELKVLIRALTYSDITNRRNKSNPNRRWGYEEVLKWCAGIKQAVPGESMGLKTVSGNIKPYRFLGNIYTDKNQLINALVKNWNEGKKQLFRGLLSAYFKDFDAEIAGYCMDAEEEVNKGDPDLVFFKTLYKIDPLLTTFYWKELEYSDISIFGDNLLHCLRDNRTKMTDTVDELLGKGVISQYVLIMDQKNQAKSDAIKAIEDGFRSFSVNPREKVKYYYLLGYMLSGKKLFIKFGTEFETLPQLIDFLTDELKRSYRAFENHCYELIDSEENLDVQFESWLIALGKNQEINSWKNRTLG